MTQKKQVLQGLQVLFLLFNCQTPEWIDLQSECVSVINLYLKDCNYELKAVGKYGDKVEYDLVELSGVKGKILFLTVIRRKNRCIP